MTVWKKIISLFLVLVMLGSTAAPFIAKKIECGDKSSDSFTVTVS